MNEQENLQENVTPVAEENPLDAAAKTLADYFYKRTALPKVTARKPLLLSPPFGLTKEAVTALLAGLGTESAHPALQNIARTQGKKDLYYYDQSIMTRAYAELDALLEDKDILATIAAMTRTHSKLYPRPTRFSELMSQPYRFTRDEILGAVARMRQEEQYKDIGVVTASNGASALYSEQFLSKRYAQSLIEKFEVEDPANP